MTWKKLSDLTSDVASTWPDNTSGTITPALLRSTVDEIINAIFDRIQGQGTVFFFEDYGAVGNGSTDDTTAVQNTINALPLGGTVLCYPGKKYVLSSTINLVSLTHPKIIGVVNGDCLDPGANGTDAPGFLWNGAANGIMFNVESCFNPTISGFNFTSNVAINAYIVSDKTGESGVTGTGTYIEKCNFVNPTNNTAFIAISISPTSTTNQENAIVRRCGFQGSGSTSFCGTHGFGTGSTKVFTNTTDSPFNSGMAGKRIRLSYQVPGSNTRGFIDDVIASYGGPTNVTLTTNNVPNQTDITCHVDQCYGVGIQNGNSQNAKHHKFIENFSQNMCTVIACIGGSCSVDHLNGESDDFGIVIGYTMSNGEPNTTSSHITEPCVIRYFESEANRIGIFGTGNGIPIKLEHCRIDNTKQDARGFFQITDASIENSGPLTVGPGAKQIAIGRIGGFGSQGSIVSRGNIWGYTPSQVGITTWSGYANDKSQWIADDQFDDNCLLHILGGAKAFAQLPSNPCYGMQQIISDSSTSTLHATISGGGGNTVLAMFNGSGNWIVLIGNIA